MSYDATIEKLKSLRLTGMTRAYELILSTGQSREMSSEELVSYLVESEWDDRQNQKVKRLMKTAKFRYQANIEDINYSAGRNLEKSQILRFSDCGYLERKENIIITGATGVGKSYLSTALGVQACIRGYKVMYFNFGKILSLLKMKRADGSFLREISKLERKDLLIIDDFGLSILDVQNRLDLLEIMEDRCGKSSTIITSQLPIAKWHDVVGDATIADAILDRILHNAHRIELNGPSLRKKI